MAHQGMTQNEIDIEGAREEGKSDACNDWYSRVCGVPLIGLATVELCRRGELTSDDLDLPFGVRGNPEAEEAYVEAYKAKITQLADQSEKWG